MARAKRQQKRGFNRKNNESKLSKKQSERVISIAALFCVSSALVVEKK